MKGSYSAHNLQPIEITRLLNVESQFHFHAFTEESHRYRHQNGRFLGWDFNEGPTVRPALSTEKDWSVCLSVHFWCKFNSTTKQTFSRNCVFRMNISGKRPSCVMVWTQRDTIWSTRVYFSTRELVWLQLANRNANWQWTVFGLTFRRLMSTTFDVPHR